MADFDPLEVRQEGDKWRVILPGDGTGSVVCSSRPEASEFANVPTLLAKYPTAKDVQEEQQLEELKRARDVLERNGRNAGDLIYREIDYRIREASEWIEAI